MVLPVNVFYTVHTPKMVYRQITTHRQIHRSTHASQMLVGPVLVNKPKFQYLHGSWFLVVQVPHLSGAGQSGLLWDVLSAKFDVTIPDGPDSTGALPTDGAGDREVSSPNPTMGSSFLPCSRLELMGSK